MTPDTPLQPAQVSKSGRFRSRRRLLVGGLVVVVLAAGALFFQHSRSSQPAAVAPPAPAPPLPKEIALGRKRTLQDLLLSEGFAKGDAACLTRALGAQLNLRRLKPEDNIQLHRDGSGVVIRLVYTQSPIDIYEATRNGAEWAAIRRDVPVERRVVRVNGTLKENLFESMEGLGERPQLVINFAEVFAWDFDFAQDSQPGDQFRMLVEKVYTGETFVRYGRILAAEYDNQGRLHTAVQFKDREGSGYYTPSGESLRRSFLKSPLEFSRITSRYSRARRHPILGGVRPHLAVDYAAPSGTPVMAVADGSVEQIGWKDGNGNTVLIRHRANFKTMYNHLSGFAKGIRAGAAVRQKQVIGYVGSTGLSTGPHLDYRVMKNGKFVNPLKESFLPGQPISSTSRKSFEAERTALLQKLRAEPAEPAASTGPSKQ